MKAKLILLSFLLIMLDLGLTSMHIKAAKQKVVLMNWEKANEVLPKFSEFTVLDLETKKKFQVQRRAGSRHADVQPLTKNDTIIMKDIYNGEWSWRRRSIIVLKGNKRIAASMHGMPHGAGVLDNNFPGHFCIHFYGSTTHRTNNMDLSHKLMILKASKQLDDYLANADPYEVIRAYISGLKEQDKEITKLISIQPINWQKVFGKIETAGISQMTILPVEDLVNDLYISIPVNIEWYFKDLGQRKFYSNIILVRPSQLEPWKIDSQSFLTNNELSKQKKKKSLSD